MPYVLYTRRTFAIRTFALDVLLSIRTLCCTHFYDMCFCPWRTFVHAYLIMHLYVLLRYVLLSLTYFYPFVLYTVRTFAMRTFVLDVVLSMRTLYCTNICDTYFCPTCQGRRHRFSTGGTDRPTKNPKLGIVTVLFQADALSVQRYWAEFLRGTRLKYSFLHG